jgi:hypothetical protein
MAFGIVHHFPGGTQAQYDASLAAVHPSKTRLPKGQIFHAAGASAGGWTIVAIHDSRESWERFRDDMLQPRLSAGVKGGFTSPPQETTFEVHNLQRQGGATARPRATSARKKAPAGRAGKTKRGPARGRR